MITDYSNISEGRIWDIGLSKAGGKEHPAGCYNLPNPVFRALTEAGLWRATVELVDEGILIRPYKGVPRGRRKETVVLPNSWGNGT